MSERIDPWDVAFGQPGLAERHFPAIAAAGAERGMDLGIPDVFLMLPEVGDLIRELGPEGSLAGFTQLGLLSFHGFQFWRAGQVRVPVDEATLRAVIADPALGPWRLQAPAPAGYVQLPRHQVWTLPAASGTAAAVDGFFWSLGAAPRLELLLVEGLLAESEAFSVFEVGAPLPREGHWGDVQARDVGADFANLLPGGELRGLHGLTTAGELLKLASRLFHHHERHGPLRDRAGAGGDRQSSRADG